MTTRILFNIVAKVLGLLFIQNLIDALLGIAIAIDFFIQNPGAGLSSLIIAFLRFALYGLITFLFIFKSNALVDKLKLHEGFGIDVIPLNVHRSTIINISVIVIGGLMVANAIPDLCRQLFIWYQKSEILYSTSFEISHAVLSASKLLVGLLMLGYHRHIVGWIELRQRSRKA